MGGIETWRSGFTTIRLDLISPDFRGFSGILRPSESGSIFLDLGQVWANCGQMGRGYNSIGPGEGTSSGSPASRIAFTIP